MEMGGVERVGVASQLELRRGPADVAPALGVESTGRMEDDSYRGNARDQDRGMEEEGTETDEQIEDAFDEPIEADEKKVDLLA